jgi:hypothetical protein
MRQKRIVKVETMVLLDFPEDWNNSDIEFYLNDSSSCSSNVLSALADSDDELECGCSVTTMTVVSDPTDEDIAAHRFIDLREKNEDSKTVR